MKIIETVLESAKGLYCERCFLTGRRIQGAAALAMGNWDMVDECFREVLDRARAVELVQAEISALIGLADLQMAQGYLQAGIEFLNHVWKPAERGPCKLLHVDALNSLSRIERKAGILQRQLKRRRRHTTLRGAMGRRSRITGDS